MLRNDLITALSQQDNDTVTVYVGGILVDVDRVARVNGTVTIVLDPDDIESTIGQIIRKRLDDGTLTTAMDTGS